MEDSLINIHHHNILGYRTMNKNITLIFNSFFNVLYKTLNVVFPLITTAYVSRVLGASGMGEISSVQNITQYFVMLSCLGIPTYGIREIAKCSSNIEKRRQIFSELFLINFLSTLLCSMVYYGSFLFIDIGYEKKLLFIISGISIILNFFNVEWFYQGIEKYRFIALRNFCVKIILIICIFLFVKTSHDTIIYLLLLIIGTGGNNILNVICLKKNNIYLVFKNLFIRRHIKNIIVLLCITISVELYTMIDTTMLTILCESDVVGYYANSIKMIRMIVTVLTGISGVLLPRISKYIAEGNISESEVLINKALGIVFLISLPCMLGVQICSKEIVLSLFGNSFFNAIPTIQILSLLIMIITLSNLFTSQVLMTFGFENKIMIATIAGSIVNVILNCLFIPRYYQNGAAVASIFGELTVLLVAFFMSKKLVKYNFILSDIVKDIISAFFMCLLILSLKRHFKSNFGTLVLEIVLGCCSYFIVNFLLKNKTMLTVFKIIKKR